MVRDTQPIFYSFLSCMYVDCHHSHFLFQFWRSIYNLIYLISNCLPYFDYTYYRQQRFLKTELFPLTKIICHYKSSIFFFFMLLFFETSSLPIKDFNLLFPQFLCYLSLFHALIEMPTLFIIDRLYY